MAKQKRRLAVRVASQAAGVFKRTQHSGFNKYSFRRYEALTRYHPQFRRPTVAKNHLAVAEGGMVLASLDQRLSQSLARIVIGGGFIR